MFSSVTLGGLPQPATEAGARLGAVGRSSVAGVSSGLTRERASPREWASPNQLKVFR